MWIHSAVANANFYYSATLGLGLAHTVLTVDLVGAAIRRERLLAGKPIPLTPGSTTCDDGSDGKQKTPAIQRKNAT